MSSLSLSTAGPPSPHRHPSHPLSFHPCRVLLDFGSGAKGFLVADDEHALPEQRFVVQQLQQQQQQQERRGLGESRTPTPSPTQGTASSVPTSGAGAPVPVTSGSSTTVTVPATSGEPLDPGLDPHLDPPLGP